jgi:hypothetical protein
LNFPSREKLTKREPHGRDRHATKRRNVAADLLQMQRRAVADAIFDCYCQHAGALRFSRGRYRAFWSPSHHGHELHVGFQWKRGNWIVGKTAL